jgi:hypothetical protein
MLIHGVADDKEFVRDEVERRRGTHAYALGVVVLEKLFDVA